MEHKKKKYGLTTNFDRVDEAVLFESIMNKLKKNPHVKIGPKQIGPSEDFYKCLLVPRSN